MTRETSIWWCRHWLDAARSCRKAGRRIAAINYLACAAARRRMHQQDVEWANYHSREAA